MKPSIQGSDGIITICVIATLANIYGAVSKGKSVTIPIVGGFVVSTILLAFGQAVPKLAEMFAGAYLITSLLDNGGPVLDTVNNLVSGGAQAIKPANSTKAQTGTAVPGITKPSPNSNPRSSLDARPV